MIYSTVLRGGCTDARLVKDSDLFFLFDLTTASTSLNNQNYSEYQYFLYNTISELFHKGMNYKEIADWLNERDIKTARGKRFRNAHTHSILKKKRISDEKFQQEFVSTIENCSLEYFDKSVING